MIETVRPVDLQFSGSADALCLQPAPLWSEQAAAAAASLFEGSPAKLEEFKAFVEAGPSTKGEKRTFLTDVRPACADYEWCLR